MNVIELNEKDIIEREVEHLHRTRTGHRVVFFAFSVLREAQDAAFETLMTCIAGLVNERNTKVYVYPQGDVAILAKGLTYKIYEQIKFTVFSLPNMPAPEMGLARLFDVGVQIGDVRKALSQLTYTNFTKPEQDERRSVAAALEEKRQSIINVELNEGAVQSLPSRRARREGVSVLLIEDDVFSANLVNSLLSRTCDVDMVHDGGSGITRYAARAPDIVFLDIDLPDVSGYDILKRLLEVDSEAFIVMLSAHRNPENVMTAVRSGAQGFIGKPFTQEKLMEFIARTPKFAATQRQGAAAPV